MSTLISYLIATGFIFILNHFSLLVLPTTLLGFVNPYGILFVAGGIFFTAQYLANVVYTIISMLVTVATHCTGGDSTARAIAQIIFYPVFLIVAIPCLLWLMSALGIFTITFTWGSFAIILAYGILQTIGYAIGCFLVIALWS